MPLQQIRATLMRIDKLLNLHSEVLLIKEFWKNYDLNLFLFITFSKFYFSQSKQRMNEVCVTKKVKSCKSHSGWVYQYSCSAKKKSLSILFLFKCYNKIDIEKKRGLKSGWGRGVDIFSFCNQNEKKNFIQDQFPLRLVFFQLRKKFSLEMLFFHLLTFL